MNEHWRYLEELRAKAEDEMAEHGLITPGYRLRKLEAEFAARVEAGADRDDLRASAVAKLNAGGPLTRPEVAAYLGVSTKKIQRMEAAGTLRRCPNMGTVVLFPARDVLRLSSAR